MTPAALLRWLLVASLPAAPALAGDAEAGARQFVKCKACHSIVAPDGSYVARGGKVGPNLYGVVGRPAASLPGFRYGDGIKEAAAAGLVWSEPLIADYVKNPTAFIDSHGATGPSKMAFRLPEGGADIAAYLASIPAGGAQTGGAQAGGAQAGGAQAGGEAAGQGTAGQ